MTRPTKIVLTILTAVLTIAFLLMVAVCVTMQAEYWGMRMGNEASGFFFSSANGDINHWHTDNNIMESFTKAKKK